MPDENKVDIYMYCGYSVNADVESWESENALTAAW